MTYSYQYARRHGYVTTISNPFKYRYILDKEGKFKRDSSKEDQEFYEWLNNSESPYRIHRLQGQGFFTYIEPPAIRARRRIPRTTPPGTVIPIWQR